MDVRKLQWYLSDPSLTYENVVFADVGSADWDEYEVLINDSYKPRVENGNFIIPIYRKNK